MKHSPHSKNVLLQKVFLYLFLIGFSLFSRSQSIIGTSCTNSIFLNSADSCYQLNVPTSNTVWLKFYATSSNLSVILSNIADSVSDHKIDEIKIYSSCGVASAIDSAKRSDFSYVSWDINSGVDGDSMFSFKPQSIITGNIYFIAITLTPNSCKKCTGTSIDFDLCLISILSCELFQACDLVKNGSFETYSSCPWGGSQIEKSCGWTVPNVPSSWGSTDYFNACTVPSLAAWSIPLPSGQTAHTGSAMAGTYTSVYNSPWNDKELLQQQLFAPMVAGKTYYFEMYVMVYAYCSYTQDEIGVYFSNSQPTMGIVSLGLPVTPQIVSPSYTFLGTGWTRVSGCYTAAGGEQWITLGSFRDNASMYAGGHFQVLPSGTSAFTRPYYFYDDVSLKLLNPGTGNDQTIACTGDHVTLGQPELCLLTTAIYNWSPSTGLSNPHIINPVATPTVTTTYTLTTTSPDGCSVSETVTVTVLPQAPVDAGTDVSICSGANTLLNATGGLTYTWLPGSGLSCTNCANPTAAPTVTTTYTVTGTNENGCTGTDVVAVTVETPVVNATATFLTIPLGCKTDLSAASTITGTTFTWDPDGATGSTVSVSPSTTTTYTVTGTTPLGCTTTATVTITVIPTPFIVTGSTSACIGLTTYSVSTVIGTGVTYTWSTTTGLSGTGTTASIDFSLTGGGTITFAGTYSAGCTYTASLYVAPCCTVAGSLPTFFNTTSMALLPYGVTGTGGELTVTNQTFAINGTFVVGQDLILAGCDLRMGYLAQIVVKPGFTLTLTSDGTSDKTHIYACNEMWGGIYVTDPTEKVIIDNGTTIEDALNAVYSSNFGDFQISSSPAWGNVIFNKNYKSIVATQATTATHPAYIQTTTIQCYDGVVGGNPVNTSNKLHFPYAGKRSAVGIELIDVKNITIGDPALASYLNTFDNLDFGIRGYNGNTSVFNNAFQNITASGTGDPKQPCNVGTAMCMTGNPNVSIVTGVQVGNSTGTYDVNSFNNCQFGVVANQNITLRVWRNTFTNIGSTAVRAATNFHRTIEVNENTINSARFGIECYDNRSSTVHILNNQIDAGALTQAGGIAAQEIVAGTTYYTINENTIRNVRNGIIGSSLYNSSIQLNNVSIKHTTVPTQYCRGIRLQSSALCDIKANWIEGQNSTDYWVEGISVDLSYSNKITCNEVYTMSTGMFFGGVQTPNTQIAKNEMHNNYRGLVLNYGIVGPQYTVVSGVNKPNDNRWIGMFTYHTDSYNSTGGLSPFYVRTTTGTYNPSPYLAMSFPSTFNAVPINPIAGNLATLDCPLIILPPMLTGGDESGADAELLLSIAENTIEPSAYIEPTKWMLKQSLYKYLKTDPDMVASEPELSDFQNAQTADNIGKLDNVEMTLSDPATFTEGTLTNSKTENDAVTASNDAESNSKWMNNLLLENALSGFDFTDAQLHDLRVLAAKCPYNEGQAVYQARVILSQFENVEYANECESAPIRTERSIAVHAVEDEEQAMFSVYPNPNNGTMNFSYSLPEASKGELILFDVTGRAVAKYNLQAGSNNLLSIQEKKLDNGVYFYKVVIDNELKTGDKILIIK